MSKWSLTGVSDVLAELVIPVHDDIRIGRSPDNDVVLASQNISRQHALISVQNGNLFIKDLGSSNGTSVNDKALEPQKSKHINHGDTVTFADLIFAVTDTEQDTETSQLTVATVADDVTDDSTSSASLEYHSPVDAAADNLAQEVKQPNEQSSEQSSQDQGQHTVQSDTTTTRLQPISTDDTTKTVDIKVAEQTSITTDKPIQTHVKPSTDLADSKNNKGRSGLMMWAIILIIIVALAVWLFNMN